MAGRHPIASVVIPAHDEATVIDRCLSALAPSGGDELEIIVVANACSDDTADRARAYGVQVIETTDSGKPLALNLGDRACSCAARIYLDADVELSRESAIALADVISTPAAIAAAPRLEWSRFGLTWLVRAYYEVWSTLPYVSDGMIGSGVYALSGAGRKRFGEFPPLIADDGFIAALFSHGERITVKSCTFVIHPPRNFAALVHVKARVWAGNRQLATLSIPPAPPGTAGAGRRYTATRRGSLLARPDLWPRVPVFALVYALSRLLGEWRLRTGRTSWSRDSTSRVRAAIQ